MCAGICGISSSNSSRTRATFDSNTANTCSIVRGETGEKEVVKAHRLHPVKVGDRVIKDTSGGGGVGRPEDRDPQKVWEDVFLDEIVSIDYAREAFKVVIDPATGEVDQRQTEALRAAATEA